MFSRVRVAIRFFFVGLAVGVLLAPRSGAQTRRLLRQRADRFLNDLLDATTLGVYQSSSGADGDQATSKAGSAAKATRPEPSRKASTEPASSDAVVGGD
jgi:gas vesicle protein